MPCPMVSRVSVGLFDRAFFGDTDVAHMIARYVGATLGLLAFTIVIATGLFAQNPITVTLSRSLLALFAFFMIGLVLGGAAQLVVNEHQADAHADIERRYGSAQEQEPDEEETADQSPVTEGEAVNV